MNNLINELEKYQEQFSDYGGILLKIMLRKEKDRNYILKYLIEYLKKNSKVNVVNIRQEASVVIPSEEDKEKLTTLRIQFKCSVCKGIVEEEISLRSTWIPRKTDTELICTNCCDQYSDEAYDAQEEQRYMDEEEEREYAKDGGIPFDSDSSDLKKEHEKK